MADMLQQWRCRQILFPGQHRLQSFVGCCSRLIAGNRMCSWARIGGDLALWPIDWFMLSRLMSEAGRLPDLPRRGNIRVACV